MGPDQADRVQYALERALRYLDRRDRTVAEVRGHLGARDLDPNTIDEAIRELTEQRLLDDQRYAQLFAQDKRELEQWGRDRIERTLLARGVDPGLIDAAIDGEDSGSELDRALGLLRRRFPAPPQDRRDRDRALGVLLRKGYDAELALDAMGTYARGG